jgi:hypothetical protein
MILGQLESSKCKDSVVAQQLTAANTIKAKIEKSFL